MDFSKFDNLITPPELPEGYFKGKLVSANEYPAVLRKDGSTRPSYLELTFEVVAGINVIRKSQRVYNWDKIDMPTSDGRTFTPISTVISPIRAAAKIPLEAKFSLADALKYASEHPVPLKNVRQEENNYFDFGVCYPQQQKATPKPEDLRIEPGSDDE